MRRPRLSRRTFLAGGTGLASTAIAGCLGLGESPDGEQTATPSRGEHQFDDASPISSVETTATELVVSLRDDADVSEVNLIAPDGTAFARNSVVTGETAVRIPIVDPGARRFDENHYTPGEYTVVSVTEERSYRTPIQLSPKLRIVDVRPTYDDERSVATGNLAVDVENIGSAPTWVFQVVYDGAPYPEANSGLADYTHIPELSSPDDTVDTIIAPGETSTFVGFRRPLQFLNEGESECTYDPVAFQMTIGTGLGSNPVANVRATVSGDVRSRWNYNICSDVSVEFEEVR
ncbi:hypothetical protein [Haloarchaeobius sp. HRN-SO-5]|uniref:hypothetical protein n=1 Tax=Haloarchaeobius sp. HRN-SO-5 TaxID=3446118 RepID=UPI003EB954F1